MDDGHLRPNEEEYFQRFESDLLPSDLRQLPEVVGFLLPSGWSRVGVIGEPLQFS